MGLRRHVDLAFMVRGHSVMVKPILTAASAALLLVLGAGAAAQAAGVRYDCTFDTGNARDGNWVPSVLVLQHDTGSGKVTVFDPVIKHFNGKPIEGRLSTETNARSEFAWDLNVRTARGADSRMGYTFVYYKDGRPAKIRVDPRGYDNRFSGEGTCTLSRG
jgi:hypothetical protein